MPVCGSGRKTKLQPGGSSINNGLKKAWPPEGAGVHYKRAQFLLIMVCKMLPGYSESCSAYSKLFGYISHLAQADNYSAIIGIKDINYFLSLNKQL